MARGLKNFGFRKKSDCTIRVAKTKALISFAFTEKLICVFVSAYAESRFSHNEDHFAYFTIKNICCVYTLASNIQSCMLRVLSKRNYNTRLDFKETRQNLSFKHQIPTSKQRYGSDRHVCVNYEDPDQTPP